MAFPKPSDYRTHKGPRGRPEEWAAKAGQLLRNKSTRRAEIAESLEVLGFTTMPTLEGLKKAFRTASLVAHPDQGGTQEGFIKVKKAYDLLLKKLTAN